MSNPQQWPNGIPEDLRHMLDEVAAYRSAPASADIWQVVREWLVLNGVEPPAPGTRL